MSPDGVCGTCAEPARTLRAAARTQAAQPSLDTTLDGREPEPAPWNLGTSEPRNPIYFFFGRYTCVECPKNTSAASISVSDIVGCGWIDSLRSVASAAISTASTPSAMSSPAPAPTMPTPR